MSPSSPSHVQWAQWTWWLFGALLGIWLVPLARIIPRWVLHGANAQQHEWKGPGGGLERAVPPARRFWVPLANACLWAYAASTAGHPAPWGTLAEACLASSLVLLALIDWDTTLLPDWVVFPLGLAGLAGSHAGLTQQSLLASAASAAIVPGVLGGLAWSYRRIKGTSGIGGGDLKLLAALAAWLGLVGIFYVVLWASLITVAWYLAWRHFKNPGPQAEWPFGPAIAVAALVWRLW